MDKVPEIFDWVAARAKCSVGHTFALLMERVDTDVKAMQNFGTSMFELTKVASSKFVVGRTEANGMTVDSVVFERTRTGVAITKGGNTQPFLVLTVAVGPDHRCLYEMNDQVLELWQVSRKALEELFFVSGLRQ